MGGVLHPVLQGENAGREIGLQNDLTLIEIVHNLDFGIYGADYWIGFGAGYVKGQELRSKIRTFEGGLSFEEYIDCTLYLFSKSNYGRCNPQGYLAKMELWDKLEIEWETCQKVLSFCEGEKIQRALNELCEYYERNFGLKAVKEIDKLLQDLKQVRNNKKENANYDTSTDKAEIIVSIKSWCDAHASKQE